MEAEKIVEGLIELPHEIEWAEFKVNFFNPEEIGRYISAISNAAAMAGRKAGYMVWGVDDSTHQVIGTDFDCDSDVKHEPLKHYLARGLSPSLPFDFGEGEIGGRRIVVLEIPAASGVPTEFEKERYIRIGSSKENLRKYPQREATLWNVLDHGVPSLTNTDSERQELTFEKLFLYYASKGKTLNKDTFEQNLSLRNEASGKYNLLALLVADDNAISVRVSIFNGTRKSDGLKSVKEFGNTCILYALNAVANYGRDVLNVPVVNEKGRVLERNDKYLFDNDAYREAVINAFVHNDWMSLDAPQISVFADRIEIISHGTIGPDQTYEGFFKGVSKPVNPALAHILLQLEISDRSGKGVPTIVDRYGENCFDFGDGYIDVTIPFANLLDNRTTAKDLILLEIKADPHVTAKELASKLSISLPMATKHLRELKESGKIIRVGPNKNGHWELKK